MGINSNISNLPKQVLKYEDIHYKDFAGFDMSYDEFEDL